MVILLSAFAAVAEVAAKAVLLLGAEAGGRAVLQTPALVWPAALAGSMGLFHLTGHGAVGSALAAILGGRLPWYVSRAAAITAYLLLSGTR